MKKILVLTPIPYGGWEGFYFRDNGITVRQFRQMGVDARLVVLKHTDNAPYREDMPTLTVTLRDMENAEWWREQNPWGAVLALWNAPRYDMIRQAALAVTPRVIERMDTDGVRSPAIWPRQFLRPYSSVTRGVVVTLARMLFPALIDRKIALTMSRMPVMCAESPLAVARIQRIIRMHGLKPPRIAMISHPADTLELRYQSGCKTNQVISVAGWARPEKDLPRMIGVMRCFLELHRDWCFCLVGDGVSEQILKEHGIKPDLLKRIRLTGWLTHDQLSAEYNRSRIFVLTSIGEGQNISAGEALVNGCSYVSAANLNGNSYLASMNSGTIAPVRSIAQICDALNAEVNEWATGRREPDQIAAQWNTRLGAESVCRQLLAELELAGGENKSL
jgi:glycosyltransferase involved in cell wall biosynthesis